MSVTTKTPSSRVPTALAPIVAQARMMAGVPEARHIKRGKKDERKTHEKQDDEFAQQFRAAREAEAAKKRRLQEQEDRENWWLLFAVLLYWVHALKQNPNYQPEIGF